MNTHDLMNMWISQDPVSRNEVLNHVRTMPIDKAFALARAIGDIYGQNAWRVKVQEFMTVVEKMMAQPVANTELVEDTSTL